MLTDAVNATSNFRWLVVGVVLCRGAGSQFKIAEPGTRCPKHKTTPSSNQRKLDVALTASVNTTLPTPCYHTSNQIDVNRGYDCQGTRSTLIGRVHLLSWMMTKLEMSQKAFPLGKSGEWVIAVRRKMEEGCEGRS